MNKVSILLMCAVGALVTVDHVSASGSRAVQVGAKADRLAPADALAPASRDAVSIRTSANTTVVIRSRLTDQMARDMSASRPARPAVKPVKEPAAPARAKRLPHACEPSVSPLASSTTFGARCVT